MREASPYRTAPGSVPPELAGRDGELGAAREAVEMAREHQAPDPLIFIGRRGLGKTALLRQVVREAANDGAVSLALELDRDLRLNDVIGQQLKDALESQRRLPARLRSVISAALDHLPKISYELPLEAGSVALEGRAEHDEDDSASTNGLEAELIRLSEALHEHGRFLLIAVDEVQEGSRSALLPLVRATHATSASTKPILFVGAGLPNTPMVLEATRTYTERWTTFRLDLLTRGQTETAVVNPARALGVPWDHAAVDTLYQYTRGYPYALQRYARAAWNHARGERVRKTDVEFVHPGVRKQLDTTLHDPSFEALSPREARFVLALASLDDGAHRIDPVARALGQASSAGISSTRGQLVQKEVIYSPNRGLVEFRLPSTIDYIERHRDVIEKLASF